MKGRIPVVYILSNGRSGTTLLDMLLGSAPSAWTMGEAQLLPWELRKNHSPCGCGRDLTACPFWQRVLPEVPVDEGPYPIERFRERHGGGRVLRWGLLPSLVRGRTTGAHRRAVEEYGRVNENYFTVVRREVRRTAGFPGTGCAGRTPRSVWTRDGSGSSRCSIDWCPGPWRCPSRRPSDTDPVPFDESGSASPGCRSAERRQPVSRASGPVRRA